MTKESSSIETYSASMTGVGSSIGIKSSSIGIESTSMTGESPSIKLGNSAINIDGFEIECFSPEINKASLEKALPVSSALSAPAYRQRQVLQEIS